MTTISVPLPHQMAKELNNLVKMGIGSNKADVVRRAITRFLEEEAVAAVLRAEREPSLSGDLRALAKTIK
ncbi:MAG: ribbon-helix-helix domain-containing protein [bacterium]